MISPFKSLSFHSFPDKSEDGSNKKDDWEEEAEECRGHLVVANKQENYVDDGSKHATKTLNIFQTRVWWRDGIRRWQID